MADKAIHELPLASQVTSGDLFVLEQANTAKRLTGASLEAWLLAMADGHGGITSIEKIGSAGTDPVVDTYRITLADEATFDFEVTNGLKGDTGDAMYLYIRYASAQPASDSDMKATPDSWMGIYTGLEDDPADLHYTDYVWYQIKGATGDPGTSASITSQTVEYQEYTSGTVIPTGTWSQTVPPVAQGNYLWCRTTISFNTGNPVVIYSVSHAGMDGTGTGDMRAAVYDPQGDIANLPGGIPQYVGNQIPGYEIATPQMDGEGSAGTNNSIARGNHVHPKDTSKADLVGGKVKPDQASSDIFVIDDDMTLSLANAGKFGKCINTAAITITIPADENDEEVDFPVKTEIEICRYSVGSVTIAGETGVTINSIEGKTDIADQNGCVCLKKIASDEWLLAGDLG